jgi:hypothetical protein
MEAEGEGTRADITMTSEVARELAVKTVEMTRRSPFLAFGSVGLSRVNAGV